MHPVEALCQCALNAPSADNSQPFNYYWSPGKVTCRYAAERVGKNTFSASDSASLIAAGSAYSNVILAADNLSIAIKPSIDLQELDNPYMAQYFSFEISQDINSFVDEIELRSLAIFQRHTNRQRYSKQKIDFNILTFLQKQIEGTSHLSLRHETADIQSLGKLLERASVIRFHTREAHEWLSRSIRYEKDPEKKREGLDIGTLALPPGGSIFMRAISDWKRMRRLNHLGAARFMAKIDSSLIKESPALLIFIGDSTPLGAFNTGQLMTRIWTHLNGQGVAVQPYYVLSDLKERQLKGGVPLGFMNESKAILAQLDETLKLGMNERMYMVFRLGYPTKAPVRSLRLPLDKVLLKTI